MRRVLLSMVFFPWAACGPKVSTTTPPVGDEELVLGKRPVAEVAEAPPAERPVAPRGKGLREGTITRASLLAVLDAGPSSFLRQFEIVAAKQGDRFVGWELVQLLDPNSPLAQADLLPGDVLLAINGKPLSRPDQMQAIWDSLRTANELKAQIWRGDAQLTLSFAVDPKL